MTLIKSCEHQGDALFYASIVEGNRYGFFRVTQQWHAPRTKTNLNHANSVGKMHGEREKDNLSLIGSNPIEVLSLLPWKRLCCVNLETVPDVYIPSANK